MKDYTDNNLFRLICSGDPSNADDVHAILMHRAGKIYQPMMSVARARARKDETPEDFVANCVIEAFRIIQKQCDIETARKIDPQRRFKKLAYKFDPAIAQFDAWLMGLLGGAPRQRGERRKRGVIDTMRQSRRREIARFADVDPVRVIDRQVQDTPELLVEAVQELSANDITPDEKLLLELELYTDTEKRLSLTELRKMVRAAGADELGIMKRALQGGIGRDKITILEVAIIFGVSDRTIRSRRKKIYEKLRQKFSLIPVVRQAPKKKSG